MFFTIQTPKYSSIQIRTSFLWSPEGWGSLEFFCSSWQVSYLNLLCIQIYLYKFKSFVCVYDLETDVIRVLPLVMSSCATSYWPEAVVHLIMLACHCNLTYKTLNSTPGLHLVCWRLHSCMKFSVLVQSVIWMVLWSQRKEAFTLLFLVLTQRSLIMVNVSWYTVWNEIWHHDCLLNDVFAMKNRIVVLTGRWILTVFTF